MWNVNAAVEHLRSAAQPASTGQCARYVREAIAAGGVSLAPQLSAKDYGPSLTAAGYVQIALGVPTSGNPSKPGDVAVFGAAHNSTSGEHGHMQMYDGAKWISDFVQRRFSPGPAYSSVIATIYRYRDLM